MADWLLYWLAAVTTRGLQALPLAVVARIGRVLGQIVYWLDFRHRSVARRNLELCFGGEKAPAEIGRLARENFRRIGESYCSAIKTAAMSDAELQFHCELIGIEKLQPAAGTAVGALRSRIVVIGHFGNFELYAQLGHQVPGLQPATTYRGLKHPRLERLMQSLRERSGCIFFERRTEGAALRAALRTRPLLLGLLADQHAGRGGLRLPFFGHDCSTSAAPAVLALRYRCLLHTGFCFRTGPGRWRIEVGDRIATWADGRPRRPAEIMLEVNRAFESAVRRDPANWFWVHNRWKLKP